MRTHDEIMGIIEALAQDTLDEQHADPCAWGMALIDCEHADLHEIIATAIEGTCAVNQFLNLALTRLPEGQGLDMFLEGLQTIFLAGVSFGKKIGWKP